MPILRRNLLICTSVLAVILLSALPSSSSYSVPFLSTSSLPQCVAELSDISVNKSVDIIPFEFEALTTVNDFDPVLLRPPPQLVGPLKEFETGDDVDNIDDFAHQDYITSQEQDEEYRPDDDDLGHYIPNDKDDDFPADDQEDYYYEDDDEDDDVVVVKTEDGQLLRIDRAEFEADIDSDIDDGNFDFEDIEDSDEYFDLDDAERVHGKAASLVYANLMVNNTAAEFDEEY